MEGLKGLEGAQDDTEIVDVLFNAVLSRLDRESREYEDVLIPLITGYTADPRVKALATQALSERTGWYAGELYAAVARTYGNDEELQPGPFSFRREVANQAQNEFKGFVPRGASRRRHAPMTQNPGMKADAHDTTAPSAHRGLL
jgi:hypothetical protein